MDAYAMDITCMCASTLKLSILSNFRVYSMIAECNASVMNEHILTYSSECMHG